MAWLSYLAGLQDFHATLKIIIFHLFKTLAFGLQLMLSLCKMIYRMHAFAMQFCYLYVYTTTCMK
jgi:hypothetical protein